MHKTCESVKRFVKEGGDAPELNLLGYGAEAPRPRRTDGLEGEASGDGGATDGRLPKARLKFRLMVVREGRAASASIRTPEDAYRLLAPEVKGLDREKFWRVDLDTRNNVLGYEVVSMGIANASLVHPREVFRGAVAVGAVSIVVAHNHPSQETSPSPEDKQTTRRLAQAGRIMGIPLADHLVLSETGFFSFRTAGLL